jgi:predicted nucleotide-binding protein (sugar kinase/HSP70/actin superfamily)
MTICTRCSEPYNLCRCVAVGFRPPTFTANKQVKRRASKAAKEIVLNANTNAEALRDALLRRSKERIADMQRMSNEAHKEGDQQSVVLARHAIGENQRFIKKLEADDSKKEQP